MCRHTRIDTVLLVILGLLLSACSGEWSTYPVQKQNYEQKTQYINIGDKVNVQVFNDTTLSGEYPVLRDGTIHIPLINAVHVDGMVLEDAAKVITQQLIAQGYLIDPKVTLSLSQSQSVMVMGEIITAGEYPYKEGMTILDLVAKAGGFSYRANQTRFDIVRKNPHGEDKVIQGELSTRIDAGDLIRVRERYF